MVSVVVEQIAVSDCVRNNDMDVYIELTMIEGI